ncbi:MAG: YajQ family cyclic di-GMP-binding protein [Nitrospirae bacterium]|nr:YajQ family cyclic di-GMP-binding protein [Nitrospirota bacterium]
MAKEHSMDVSVQFDFQELKNAVEMTKKEAFNRYDLKDAGVEIELSEDLVKLTTQGKMHIESVFGILMKKMISRGVSPKILDRQEVKEIGGMKVRQEMKLVKALDQDTAKGLAKKIRESFPKAKALIQGETLRVVSAKIDDLQAIMQELKADEKILVPLEFGNFK